MLATVTASDGPSIRSTRVPGAHISGTPPPAGSAKRVQPQIGSSLSHRVTRSGMVSQRGEQWAAWCLPPDSFPPPASLLLIDSQQPAVALRAAPLLPSRPEARPEARPQPRAETGWVHPAIRGSIGNPMLAATGASGAAASEGSVAAQAVCLEIFLCL
eukprot:2915759-Rhodomonas_salina.3